SGSQHGEYGLLNVHDIACSPVPNAMRLCIIFAMLLLVVAGVAWRFASSGSAPQIGTTAPEFTLPSQDGVPVSLKDYRGKWVELYFYPKDFTRGCTIEAHTFQRD